MRRRKAVVWAAAVGLLGFLAVAAFLFTSMYQFGHNEEHGPLVLLLAVAGIVAIPAGLVPGLVLGLGVGAVIDRRGEPPMARAR